MQSLGGAAPLVAVVGSGGVGTHALVASTCTSPDRLRVGSPHALLGVQPLPGTPHRHGRAQRCFVGCVAHLPAPSPRRVDRWGHAGRDQRACQVRGLYEYAAVVLSMPCTQWLPGCSMQRLGFWSLSSPAEAAAWCRRWTLDTKYFSADVDVRVCAPASASGVCV